MILPAGSSGHYGPHASRLDSGPQASRLRLVFALLICLLYCACKSPDQEAQRLFTDITVQSKLNFVHDAGVDGSYFMPESLGSGAALFDYNDDGLLDIYLVNAGSHQQPGPSNRDRLFQQQKDGSFEDMTAASGFQDTDYGLAVAAGDMNNDGCLDLYVTSFGKDRLWRNNCGGTFTEVTAPAGIRNEGWSSSVAWVDYNLDNYLDIYVATYVDYNPAKRCTDKAGRPEYCGPQGFSGLADVLYRNNGDGTFTDVSDRSGIAATALKGLGIVAADFNNDSYPDIYVANDGEPNHLWMNQRDGTFRDVGAELGAATNALGQPEASMGVTAGDADSDGDLDLFMTHLRDEKNTFYRNLGAAGFQDDSWSTALGPPSLPFTGFGAGFFDFDNDGDLDIAVVNGRIARGPLLKQSTGNDHWDAYAEPNFLFRNNGDATFADASKEAGAFTATIENSRGLAFGDLDNDGDVDLLVTRCGGPAALYRNETKGNWILIRAFDTDLKRDAIGAKITVQVQGKKWIRLVAPAYSYLCSNDVRVHFGLGKHAKVDSMEVQWPDGTHEMFKGVTANQIVILKKGQGSAKP